MQFYNLFFYFLMALEFVFYAFLLSIFLIMKYCHILKKEDDLKVFKVDRELWLNIMKN